MTCERSEFVTSAYKYSASVANFVRMSNLLIRKHIPKHIRLCVRAALVKKKSIAPIKKVFSIFQSVYFMFVASANSAKMPFLIISIPHGLSTIRLFSCRVQ